MDLTIRRALVDDAEGISQLIRNAMVTYKRDSGISGDVLESLHESVESVATRIKYSRCLCLYSEEKIPVGTITITAVSNPLKYSFSEKTEAFLRKYKSCGYISRFAVDDSVRSTGLGVKLIEAALECPEATESGIVLLHTATANKSMNEFYKNRGFYLLDSEKSRGYERGLYVWEKKN